MSSQLKIDLDNHGQRLDRYLKRHSSMNYLQIQKFLRIGRVRVNGKRARGEYQLVQGDLITLPQFVAETITETQILPPLPPNFLIHETEDYLFFNKPSGLASQGGTGISTHVDLLLEHYQNSEKVKPRLVHRLDRETSGMLMVARNRNAALHAGKAFAEKHIQKYYLAISDGILAQQQGEIHLRLKRERERTLINDKGQEASTHYQILSQKSNSSLILLMPVTGRTHQLRVHLAANHAAIIGDKKYGTAKNNLKATSLFLHAYRLIWASKEMDFTAPLPPYFEAMLEMCELKLPKKAKLLTVIENLNTCKSSPHRG